MIYLTDQDRFAVAAFDGWNLTERDFNVRQWNQDDLQALIQAGGRELENYE